MAYQVYAVHRHPPTIDENHWALVGTYNTRAKAEKACQNTKGIWDQGINGPKKHWIRQDKVDYWCIKEIP